MTFTGTLIEDLMATVERAEERARAEAGFFVKPMRADALMTDASRVESALAEEAWFASVQENRDYDSKLLGVA
jgi:hypothetical protein